jgi:hypothetical protein
MLRRVEQGGFARHQCSDAFCEPFEMKSDAGSLFVLSYLYPMRLLWQLSRPAPVRVHLPQHDAIGVC